MYLVPKGGKQNHGQVQLSSFSNRRLEEKLPLGMLLEGGTKAIKRGRKIKKFFDITYFMECSFSFFILVTTEYSFQWLSGSA